MTPQILSNLRSAHIIESETVDQRAILRKTKDARLRIPALPFVCDRADFDESKTERCKFANVSSVLIKTGRKSDRISKLEAESLELAEWFALQSSRNSVPHK